MTDVYIYLFSLVLLLFRSWSWFTNSAFVTVVQQNDNSEQNIQKQHLLRLVAHSLLAETLTEERENLLSIYMPSNVRQMRRSCHELSSEHHRYMLTHW